MTMTPGTRLGPYEIVSRIGAGGMGEVFRAKDTRLDRSVAIKILPESLAHDAQFRARFEREARLVSSLNHPNICTLHDVGNADGVEYLVMELLEGESLADRLAKGPLPIAQVLSIGMQIASALEKAHRQGVVHRDLKPANVMLTKGGAKLLDFGLAKSREVVQLSGPSSVNGATEHRPLTQEGTILGTFQYMAPEQLDGLEADARTDIFAFGALLYEMATGKRAFEGRTRSSLIAAIVQGRPRPISELQPLTPPALERVIATCLEKDPDDRIQTAHDVLLQLKWIAEGGSEAGVAAPVIEKRKRRDRLKWIAACAAAAAMAAVATWALKPDDPPPAFSFTIPASEGAYHLAETAMVSPDGKRVVFRSSPSSQLWVRSLDSMETTLLPGTENSYSRFFWSPDGNSIAFWQNGSLMKVSPSGGGPQKIAALPSMWAGAWSSDGTILIAPFEAPLAIIRPGSSTATSLTTLDKAKFETGHVHPLFLPNGKDFLFVANTNEPARQGDRQRLYAGSTESKTTRFLGNFSSQVRYAEGMLLYVREGTLLARPFDAGSLEFTGQEQTLVENVFLFEPTGDSAFSVSNNGVLVVQASSNTARLFRMAMDGTKMVPLGITEAAENVRVAPDGKQLVAAVKDPKIGSFDLWIYGLDRPTTQRLTSHRGWENNPVWSPDGSRIYYASDLLGHPDIFEKILDAPAEDRLVIRSPHAQVPSDVSPDGKHLLYNTAEDEQIDVYVFPLDGKAKPYPFVKTPFFEDSARFSPDGRHVVYASNESGKYQVYVRPFPGPGPARQISTGEMSNNARWASDGKRIFFRSGLRKIMAIRFDPATGRPAGEPAQLFEAQRDVVNFQVLADGEFLISLRDESASPPNRVYVNWKRLLK